MLKRHGWRWMICLFLVALVLPALADEPFSLATTPGELPKTAVPHHYELHLQPDLKNFTTRGTEIVDVEVLQPVKEIVLNAVDLQITKATLLGDKTKTLQVTANPAKQTVRLRLPKKLMPGNYRLALEFTGKMGEQDQGLFYVKYATPTGKKIMIATQMEPVDARRMFPCWDEPVFRATFDLSVTLPENFKAVSNMPVEKESPTADGLKETKFAQTPPMATYLVLLVAGELEELSGEAEGVQIHIITTVGKREQGQYALAITKKLLAYYDNYFGIKFPLPKLDQIAIPGGFDGAMENWGAITYNESVLLYDPQASSPETQRNIFITVAHEMSHQWFGDLVTTAWWNNLWLNEGFATWMEVKATDHFNPEWQTELSAISDKSAVMSGDAHSTTHPIQSPVNNESEANDAFDSITYQKGGAFLRMLEDYLGPDLFRSGIQEYLTEHKYSSATTADLWNALEKVSGKPISAIAGGWTSQPGLPVVSVRAECDNGRQLVALEQKRFTVQDPHAEPLQWQIPITLATAGHPGVTTRILLTNLTGSINLPDCADIPKANAGDSGYYRVHYSPELFEKLQNSINQWPPADRLNLLDDCWAIVEANRMSAAQYFDLVMALKNERTLAIWDEIISTLYLVDNLEQGQPGRTQFQTFAQQLLRPLFVYLGWEHKTAELPNNVLLRNKVIAALGHFGDQAIIAEAKARFEKFVAQPESLPPDLRPAVLKIAGRYADQNIYDQLHQLAIHASGTEERESYYNAMSAALDPALARQTLAISLTDETVPQEATELVVNVADAGEQRELAWDFATQHVKELLAKVDYFDRNNYMPSILASFSDTERADELEAYAKKNGNEDALVKTRETAEEIRFKAMLKRKQIPAINDWVKSTIQTQPK
jgi:aminopeptidase N